ncbi:baseplate J/gp47 family protein [Thomasclavelia spiroformis]|uniref:baseplate J/gp47 family protein n=1 Tax=Thomasclavelia spiroformis TaxID=29348 RepID=UPI00320B462C
MYENMSVEVILERMIDRVIEQDNTLDTREGSIIYNALAPAAVELMGMYIEAQRIMDETFADTASREYLIKRCKERGISPQPATNAILKGVFEPSTLEIPIGSRYSLENLNYVVIEKITNGEYQVQCETAGIDGNAHFGTLIPIEYIDGLQSAELTELLIPGEDEESTESLRNRYYQSLEAESYGGNKMDYKTRVRLISGVGGVKVYSGSEWNGGGTVKIVITDSTFGKPTPTLVETVQEEIDPVDNPGEGIGIAPIGHIVTVAGVNEVSIDIELLATLQPGYEWSNVQTQVESAIDEYFASLNEDWENQDNIIVRISQIETRLLQIPVIIDVMGTKINGVEENYTADKDSIVKRGEVTNAR